MLEKNGTTTKDAYVDTGFDLETAYMVLVEAFIRSYVEKDESRNGKLDRE